jgi:hypothetical protein
VLNLKGFSPVFNQEIAKKNSEDNYINVRSKISKDKAVSYREKIFKQTAT